VYLYILICYLLYIIKPYFKLLYVLLKSWLVLIKRITDWLGYTAFITGKWVGIVNELAKVIPP